MRTKKTLSESETAAVIKPREKKVYSLAGQRYDVPEEREPLRIFYESLSQQIPSSEMAEFWLMEHGLLSPERAKKAYEKKQMKQKQLRTKSPSCLGTSKSLDDDDDEEEVKANNRVSSEDSDDDDNHDNDHVVCSQKKQKL